MASLHGCRWTMPSRPHLLLREAGNLLALYMYFYVDAFIAVCLYIHTKYKYANIKMHTCIEYIYMESIYT